MADRSKIAWCDSTWNPVVGCSRISSGCTSCYAERMAWRLNRMGVEQYIGLTHVNDSGEGDHGPRWTGETRLVESALDQPLRWRKPRRIFVCSMGDLFHESVQEWWINAVFGVMAATPQHTYQVLTKRPERMREYLSGDPRFWDWVMEHPADCGEWDPRTDRMPDVLPNVWLGTTCEDQRAADERIPHLLATPAAVRWVSYEPALGPVDFSPWLRPQPVCCGGNDDTEDHRHTADCAVSPEAKVDGIDWVVCGGESGPGARPMHPQWARDVRDQCAEAGVAFFMKQMSRRESIPDDLMIREMPEGER